MLLSLAVLAGTMALAPTAASAGTTGAAVAAASTCRDNVKTFSRGGATKASRTITLRLCVHRDGDYLWATAETLSTPKTTSADLFYHFVVNLRLERNDADFASASDDQTGWGNYDGSANYLTGFDTPYYVSGATGGWTADGNVSYDIIGDGVNDLTWSLTGSPVLN
ncbi:hypothetical protein [Micromonospora pisi]|nr:hypothetical protein [Micromonospora pisi]